MWAGSAGQRLVRLLTGTRVVREVRAAGDGDCIRKANGGLMLLWVMRLSPGEGISAGLGTPQVGKVLLGALVGKDAKEAQELPVNPTLGRHSTGQKRRK